MKKFTIALIALFTICFTIPAHADIFGPQPGPKQKVSYGAGPDASTILSELTQIAGYLGTREGVFYDFKEGEVCNYAAATLYTYQPMGISFDFGALNLDGIAVTIDWNAGAFIPSQDVPLLNLFQYFYIGGGVGGRQIEGRSQVAYGVDAQFKFTF